MNSGGAGVVGDIIHIGTFVRLFSSVSERVVFYGDADFRQLCV